MFEMTPKQKELARHALGLPNERNISYRNHYCIGKGSPGYQEWEELVAQRLAVKRNMGKEFCGDFYYLTLDGAKQALLSNECIPRKDAAIMRKSLPNMVGKTYLCLGQLVIVLARWNGNGPHNVLLQGQDGKKFVRPFHGLRNIPGKKERTR